MYQGKKIIFAGTSCGLFSTTQLNGDSTIWTKEGATSIGNVIIDMVDARQTDGFIALGTHGNGVYSAYFNPSAGLEEPGVNQSFRVGNVYPNPVRVNAQGELSATKTTCLKTTLYATNGKPVKVMPERIIHPGKQILNLQFNDLTSGVYYLAFDDGKEKIVRKVIKVD